MDARRRRSWNLRELAVQLQTTTGQQHTGGANRRCSATLAHHQRMWRALLEGWEQANGGGIKASSQFSRQRGSCRQLDQIFQARCGLRGTQETAEIILVVD